MSLQAVPFGTQSPGTKAQVNLKVKYGRQKQQEHFNSREEEITVLPWQDAHDNFIHHSAVGNYY